MGKEKQKKREGEKGERKRTNKADVRITYMYNKDKSSIHLQLIHRSDSTTRLASRRSTEKALNIMCFLTNRI